MRKTLLFTFLLLAACIANAQVKKCDTHESMQDYRRKHPNAQTDAQFETWINQKIAARQGQRTAAYYTIPVVFHVIHDGEAPGVGSNLSQAQIQQQLDQLNADFANLSGSTYGVAATTQIQFCLATIDNNGLPMPEPGIHRVNRNSMGWIAPPYSGTSSTSYVDVTIMPGTIWNPNNYFNIWTIDLSGTLLGKATFPTASGLPGLGAGETDTHAGVFVKYQSVGSVCTPGGLGSSAGLGRTLTHEAGHFFGLRHIWGDGNCADDYCADTPPQDASTAGCPGTGAANNCLVAPGPKMFENYMDYTDDGCVNTFTADQVARIQAVMMNSPRRVSLPAAGTCGGGPSNAIRFNYTCTNVSETRVVSACPDYRDVLVNVNVQSVATGAATVTFTKSGTATDNVDYTIFPSSLTFANGETTPKTVTVRIWDDGVAESAETLTLGYTISGSGVVAGSANQSFTLTITDNDQTPVISNTGSVPLYSENFATGAPGWGVGTFTAGNNNWTISANGGPGFTNNVIHVTNNTTTRPLTYDFTSSTSRVIISPLINGTGKFNPTLSFKYLCFGELIGSTLYDYGTIMYSLNGSTFTTLTDVNGNPIYLYSTTVATTLSNIPLPAVLNNTNFYIGFRWTNNNNGTGNNPPLAVDDVMVSVAATGTEGDAGQSGTKNIFSGQDVYLASANDNQVIARITNPSANIGCLTATIAQAGNGTASVTSNAGSFLRTQKVITLVPTNPNPSVTYQATLYFSAAELAVWGASKTNLKILQVADGVSLTSTMTGANAKLITPISVQEDPINGYIAYTANFTGFSQFMLVSSNFILPVNLMTFEAQPAKRSIELAWKTAQERSNKGFHIERSTNGTDFNTIGWVKGAGTTNEATAYRYTDNYVQPNTVYYYRLNQVDIDNRSQLSAVKQAKISENRVVVTVSPNPAKDMVKLFVSGIEKPTSVSLVNAKGQTVGRWTNANLATPYTLHVARFAKGQYTLVIHLPEGDKTEQLIIQ